MRKSVHTILALLSALALFSLNVSAQVPMARNAESAVDEERLRRDVEFLSDTLFHGRETGTAGNVEAGFWISRRFRDAGLVPIGKGWSQSFSVAGRKGHNIIGMLPGGNADSKYVVVCAHYDNLGEIRGNLYPGADSNASGVSALVSLADMMHYMNSLGKTYGKNVIFVALDAKEKNSAGAERLWNRIEYGMMADPVTGKAITRDKIHAMVNLDILGSSLSPLKSGRKDYLIMLGDSSFRSSLVSANNNPRLKLELSFDYYGSKDFTRIFFRRIGDQKIFLDNGIRSVVFTSGITTRTNKRDDIASSLDYPVLRKRIILIYYWLASLCA